MWADKKSAAVGERETAAQAFCTAFVHYKATTTTVETAAEMLSANCDALLEWAAL